MQLLGTERCRAVDTFLLIRREHWPDKGLAGPRGVVGTCGRSSHSRGGFQKEALPRYRKSDGSRWVEQVWDSLCLG